MVWKVKITKAARQDIQEIKQWYKNQSYQSLKNFTEELTAAIETLKGDFIDYRKAYKNNRKLPLKKFPYFIFYRREEDQTVLINAVFHKQRQSIALNDRLDNEE